jgi:hypothetical protein
VIAGRIPPNDTQFYRIDFREKETMTSKEGLFTFIFFLATKLKSFSQRNHHFEWKEKRREGRRETKQGKEKKRIIHHMYKIATTKRKKERKLTFHEKEAFLRVNVEQIF